LFQIATTLSRLGTHDQKLSLTFWLVAGEDVLPDEEQPAARTATSAAAIRERITAARPPSESFMAPPGRVAGMGDGRLRFSVNAPRVNLTETLVKK
jgi:hypothetical protein